MVINKVIFGGDTLLDLTGDTIEPADLAAGKTAHDKSGAQITGTNTKDADTQDATASTGDILAGETAYARGAKLTGTMPNNGAILASIQLVAGEVTVPNGYHDGSGKVHIDPVEQAKIIPTNIRQGVQVLGVTGTMSGSEDVHAQTKNLTPKVNAQTYTPDSGYNYFSQVTVDAIPYSEVQNAAGGLTVSIASGSTMPIGG